MKTDRAFRKELLSLAVPIALQNLLTALIGATDALMLGRLSQDAVSAVSLANQIAFIMSLFTGSALGGAGVLIAQYWGKGDKAMVKNVFSLMLKVVAGISVVFFLLGMCIPGTLMRVYTNDPALIAIGADYLRIVSVSYLLNGVTQCYYHLMKVEDRAARAVTISVATLLTDMFLDFFLIYGVAGVPGLGANGSAWSTVAVEALALGWVLLEARRPGCIRPDRKSLRWFSPVVARDMAKISAPMLASALAWGLGFSMHSLIMGHLGSDATAAASITSVVQELITCVCKGVSAGAGIIIGKLLGQDLFEEAKKRGHQFCTMSFWVGGFHGVLLLAVGPVAAAFFVLTDAARAYLIQMLIFSGVYLFAYSLNTILVCGVLPAGGDAEYDAVSVMISMWCFALPLALLGAFVFHWPVMVVYVVMCADEIVKLPWLFRRFYQYRWLRNLTREEAETV